MEIPGNLLDWGEEFSNFDNVHPGEDAEKAVKAGTHYVIHPAWDHHGYIWFQDGQFIERVKVYTVEQKPVYGDTLQEVFDKVNEMFGIG